MIEAMAAILAVKNPSMNLGRDDAVTESSEVSNIPLLIEEKAATTVTATATTPVIQICPRISKKEFRIQCSTQQENQGETEMTPPLSPLPLCLDELIPEYLLTRYRIWSQPPRTAVLPPIDFELGGIYRK